MITLTIPEIMEYLQSSYGKITEQELSDKEDNLKQFIYYPKMPVDTIFNKVNWFQDFCILCDNKKSDRQLVQITYIIFNRTRAFMDVLLQQNKNRSADKTYENFKIHMREEYRALKEVGALTINDSLITQANMMHVVDGAT